MLENIHISDFALIDSLSLDFEEGLTVLSGETGAGKSILIGALSFLLGGRGGTEVVRAGAQEARVSGTFCLASRHKDALLWLEERGIEIEENRVLLKRYVKSSGRSGAWIQGQPVTRADLEEFSSYLVDIHGQHEHQSLLKVSHHRRFLDAYAGLTAQTEAFTSLYGELVESRRQLDEINLSEADRARRIELLSFSLEEIDSARLKEGEDEQLELEERRLSQFEEIYSSLDRALAIISGGHDDSSGDSIVSALKKAQGVVSHAACADSGLSSLSTRIESAFYEVSDVADELKNYFQNLSFEPGRLEEVQERSALLFKLKKKYASSVQAPIGEVIKYAENARAELENLSNSQENKLALEENTAVLEQKVYAAAKFLSEKRRAATEKMAQDVEAVLSHLGMRGAKFVVSLQEKPETAGGVMQRCGPYGMDDIEFLISANTGSPAKPLAKIASGGEISRVMLALKTILAESDTVDTLVFDEIDTGIGGEVSVAVGAHLKKLAEKCQIFCITHVASIAVYADNQIKIAKSSNLTSTVTQVRAISDEERVEEIARMLSGDSAGSDALDYARSLLDKYGGRK